MVISFLCELLVVYQFNSIIINFSSPIQNHHEEEKKFFVPVNFFPPVNLIGVTHGKKEKKKLCHAQIQLD